ncbi:MAG: hypothetical protein DMF56_14500 [Acidobacteria bacterium]|nr:MAG: hypothetical protein DMF56_14500 [Acidobacteriota bacterium]
MQNLPVMLATPPRRVPLSIMALNLFNPFAQIAWGVFGFAMIFGWIFMGNADFSALTFHPHGQSHGRVTSVTATGASVNHQQVMANHYEYSVADTKFHGTSYSSGNSPNVGDEVTVEYDEKNPERSRIEGMRRAQFGPAVAFVAIFPFIGLVLVAFATRTGLRRNALLRHGLLTTGLLVGRERTNVTVNNRPVWRMIFQYTGRDGQRHEASANTTDTSRLEDEAQEPLLYDPDNPSRAYVLDEAPARPQFEPNGELRGRPVPGFLSTIIPGIVIAANLLVLAFKLHLL